MIKKPGLLIVIVLVATTLICAVSIVSFMKPKCSSLDAIVNKIISSPDFNLQRKNSLALIDESNASYSLSSKLVKNRPKIQTFPLNLEVIGIIIWESGDSIAYIKDLDTKEERSYGVGDIIKGAKIVNIDLSKGVLINNQGVGYWLKTTGGRNAADENTTDEYENAIKVISEYEREVSRIGVLSRIGGNLTGALREASVRPHLVWGQVKGFIVDNIRDNGLAKEAGFQNGDIVRTVNGQMIDGFQKVLQIYRKVKNQPIIKVDLERGGQPISLTYLCRE